MFIPKTSKLQNLAIKYPKRIGELDSVFDKHSNVYIDFANMIRWQTKLGWHIDLKRMKQLFDSFSTIQKVKFYQGTIVGDIKSEEFIDQVKNEMGYQLITKPVKIMRISIDTSSISEDSPAILKQFIRHPLLQKLPVETIVSLNQKLAELNRQGIKFLEDLKCNFDVEIGRDMLLDYGKNSVDNFILCSGDSDFADPIKQLLVDGKRVVLFSTARRVASELNDLKKWGLLIFDLQKIRNFICWRREIQK